MTKKTKLLLATLAIICLTAALCAVVPTASAADSYEYVWQGTDIKGFVVSDTPVLLVADCGTSYQAIEANGTSVKSTKIEIANNKVTSTVNDTMLWIVGKSGYYLSFKNYSTNTYLNISGTNVVLQDYEGSFYKEQNTLEDPYSEKIITVTTTGVNASSSGTELQAYVRQEATSGGGGGAATTVTRYKKSSLTGETKTGLLVGKYTDNNWYAFTHSAASGGTSCRPRKVTIDGDYITEINTTNNNSTPTMDSKIDDWMSWNIEHPDDNTLTLQSQADSNNYRVYQWGITTASTTDKNMTYTVSGDGFTISSGGYYLYFSSNSSVSTTSTSSSATTFYFYEKVEEELGPTAAVKFEKGEAPAGAGEITGNMPDVQAEIGKEYTLPDCAFTLKDYNFAGWLVNGENEPKQAKEKVNVPDEGLTLTATWDYSMWVITYHYEGQEDVTATVKKGSSHYTKSFSSAFSSAQAPVGEVFSHWDKKDEPCDGNTDKQYKAGTNYNFKSDVTLVPHFAKAVKVTYDYDNGTDKVETIEPANSTIKLKNSSNVSYADHEFVAWWIDENGDGLVDDNEKYNSGAYYDLGKDDITVKALWSFEGFTITFKSQGKVIKVVEHAKVSSDTYFYFQAEGIEIPQAPEGQVFSKWTTSSKYNSYYSYTISGSADDYSKQYLVLPNCYNSSTYYKIENYEVILEAQFVDAPIECTFKFVSESGEEISSVKKTISGTSTSTSLTLSATEHDHTGDIPEDMLPYWECDGEKYNSGASIRINKTDESHEKTITVHYGKKITVTWDFNGGSPNQSSTFYVENVYAAGSKQYMSTSYKPTKVNYILLGFKCSLLGDTLCTPGTYFTVADEDMIFVAQWQYDGITLNFTNGEDTQTVEIAKDATTYKIDVNDPTPKANHYFAGWKTDGDETLYKKGDEYKIVEGTAGMTVTFTAQFNECRDVKVTFHYDGQTKEKTYKELQENVQFNADLFNELFSDVFDSEKYTFEHWYKDASFGEQMPESFYKFEIGTEDFDLYAKVEKTVAITFEYGDGLGSTTSYGTKVAVPYTDLPTKENYELKGWSKNPDTSTVDYEADPGVYVESDVDLTLYAVWEKTVWTLTFTDNGEITVEIFVNKTKEKFTIAEVLVGENLTKFQKEHKTITWKLDGTAKDVHDDITNDGDKTFVAEYTDTLYTIKFDGPGTDELQPKTAKFGEVVDLPQPERDGYTFLHWVDNTTEGKPTYTDKLTMGDKDITLTAGWTANEYTITFDTDGGSTVENVKAKADDDISSLKPADPTKTGYTFAKWVLASDDSADPEEYIFDKMPAHDVALKAIWTVNSYTLKVDKADGSQATESQVEYGTQLNLTEPTLDGYTFDGWYEGDSKFEATTMPDRNLTLTAHWTENGYTLTLDGNGGTLEQTTVTAKAGEELTLPTPTRNGYVFDGWYEGDSKFEATTMPNADKSLSAHWKIDSALFATKVQALKDATTLSGKRSAIKQVEELLALWADEENTPDATEYNTLKAQFDALSTTAAEDLSNAEKGANALVAIGTAVAALAAAACVAIIIKRRF